MSDDQRHHPTRSNSTWSTIEPETQVVVPAFMSIINDAAKYGDILDDISDDHSSGSSGLDSGYSSVDTDRSSISTGTETETSSLADADGNQTPPEADPLAEQVEKQLNLDDTHQIRSETSRLARLSANYQGTSGLDGSVRSSKQVHRSNTVDSTALSSIKEDSESVISDVLVPSGSDDDRSSSNEKAEATARIIPLLIQEFGPLTEEGEEERLIAEGDAAYFQEVAILGVVHLTTHRITFHASLLSTRADLAPDLQIIKAGPAVIHREGLHRKRRVWLELSHDMITTFPDSTDEGRVRPLRTILLSAIRKVRTIDPKEPHSLRIVFAATSTGEIIEGHVEFDTSENTLKWRKELSAAVYMYRRRRRNLLNPEKALTPQGVRFSIPLHKITSFETRSWASFATVATLNFTQRQEDGDGPVGIWRSDTQMCPVDKNGSCEPLPSETKTLHGFIRDPDGNPEVLNLALIQGIDPDDLATGIEEATDAKKGKEPTNSDQIIIDFGELTFADNEEIEITTTEEGTVVAADKEIVKNAKRVFGLPRDDAIWYTRAALGRSASLSSGFLIIHHRFVCFWSKCLAKDTKVRFIARDINSASVPSKKEGKHQLRSAFGYHQLLLQVKGHKDFSFEFRSSKQRDEAIQRINAVAQLAKATASSSDLDQTPMPLSPSPLPSLTPVPTNQSAASSQTRFELDPSPSFDSGNSSYSVMSSPLEILERHKNRVIPPQLLAHLPKAINIPSNVLYHIPKQHFACLTIGSRGDVQPYIALCLGLKKEGHEVTIVTHEEYKAWVEGFGIKHRTAGGDPAVLMKLSVENKMFSPQFFKEALGNFRVWLDELLSDSYYQVKESGATVLIESPSAMAGVHIAEALNIPYFRAFTMPWTRTTEYPHAFITPPEIVSGSLNFSTYVVFDNVFWRATAPQINKWRKKILHLHSTDLETLAQGKIPFLYNFSESVVPKPLDWADTTNITGYWFLDNPEIGWTPPESLTKWMDKARADGKAIVYIGFGSIVVDKPKAMTRSIVKAVGKSDVRAILSAGWSARLASSEEGPEIELPPEIYSVDKIPHDWLFPQIDAALHHGGAGTTGASLRAGIPTLIKPWFGDQFFWAQRVQKLGAGLRVPSLASSDLANALKKATTDRVIKEKARGVGEKIRSENGVSTAIETLYMYLHRAGKRTTTV